MHFFHQLNNMCKLLCNVISPLGQKDLHKSRQSICPPGSRKHGAEKKKAVCKHVRHLPTKLRKRKSKHECSDHFSTQGKKERERAKSYWITANPHMYTISFLLTPLLTRQTMHVDINWRILNSTVRKPAPL